MIILIYGDFCVGKDTVADILIQNMHEYGAYKILSYTTREPRYEGENTHEFCTKEEFENFSDLIAITEIGGEYYGSRKCQFDLDRTPVYVVDNKGVVDMLSSSIGHECFVLEVVRPRWLIDCPKQRVERDRTFDDIQTQAHYRIINDGDADKLERLCLDFIDYYKEATAVNF